MLFEDHDKIREDFKSAAVLGCVHYMKVILQRQMKFSHYLELFENLFRGCNQNYPLVTWNYLNEIGLFNIRGAFENELKTYILYAKSNNYDREVIEFLIKHGKLS
jgi:hypothetical protein